MARRGAPLLLIAIVGALVVAYAVRREAGAPPVVPGEGSGGPAGSSPPTALEEVGADGDPETVAAGASGRTRAAMDPRGIVLALDREDEGLWVEGRVLFPPGCPADAVPRVLALAGGAYASDLGGGPEDVEPGRLDGLHSHSGVDEQGRFRVAFASGTERGHLAVRGRYLYSPLSQEVDPREAGEIELRPLLGARITGELRAAPGAALPSLSGVAAELMIDPRDGVDAMGGRAFFRRRVALSPQGRFDFGGVATGSVLRVLIVPPEHSAAWSEALQPAPGEHLRVALDLSPGARVRGRVVDPEGQPLAGATVVAMQDANFVASRFGHSVREVETDGQGRFDLSAVREGVVSVRAQLEGWLEVSARLELRSGETREGVELALTRGRSIVGRVLLPSGEPADGAFVSCAFDMAAVGGLGGFNAIRGWAARAVADEEGRFRISGLGGGPFVLQAVRIPPGEEAPTAEEFEANPWADFGSPGAPRARAEGVEPGGREVVLELRQSLSLVGRVVDRGGEPVPRFRVRAQSESRGLIPGFGCQVREARFEGPEGDFELPGLRAGTWEVRAFGEGFELSEPVAVALPRSGSEGPLVIALVRAASASGLVLRPDGQAAAGARVTLKLQTMERMALAFHRTEVPAARCDGEGRFLLDGLLPGPVSLIAEAEGFAESAPAMLELGRGERREDMLLHLRNGGLLTGEVFGDDGRPAAGENVVAQPPGTQEILQATTDEEGAFSVEHVPPGTWMVVALPDEDRLAAMIAEGGGFASMMSGMRMAFADIQDGVETHVVIGEPAPAAVRVHGRITLDREPAPGVVLLFMSDEASASESQRFHGTDEDGRFDVLLPRPGEYLMIVQRIGPAHPEASLEYRISIPEVEEHELDVDLPVGRISGRVTGSDGRPVAEARVSLVSAGSAAGQFWGGRFSEIRADAEGRYTVDWLRAGTYTLGAGGAPFGGFVGAEGAWGRKVRERVELQEGEHLEGVDFRLEAAGEIAGTVSDEAGLAIEGASIFLRDAAGRVVERVSWTRTDAAGRFRCTGLEPGTYALAARAGALASGWDSEAQVREGRASEVDLVVAAGTVVEVSLRGESGHPIPAAVSAVDARGRAWQGLYTLSEAIEAYQSGTMARLLESVGPLPPGTYRITAEAIDGRSASRTVELDGRPRRRLSLRLPR